MVRFGWQYAAFHTLKIKDECAKKNWKLILTILKRNLPWNLHTKTDEFSVNQITYIMLSWNPFSSHTDSSYTYAVRNASTTTWREKKDRRAPVTIPFPSMHPEPEKHRVQHACRSTLYLKRYSIVCSSAGKIDSRCAIPYWLGKRNCADQLNV